MSVPDTIRVKISSEDAGSISLTPVVVQEIAMAELLEQILAVTGKDLPRICEVLLRGSLVNGSSRFRWPSLTVEPSVIENLLSHFPDPDPTLPFRQGRCVCATLRSDRGQVMVSKEIATKRRMLRHRSFWDALMETAGSGQIRYAGYSYRDKADHYRLELTASAAAELMRSAELLSHPALENQIRAVTMISAEFHVQR